MVESILRAASLLALVSCLFAVGCAQLDGQDEETPDRARQARLQMPGFVRAVSRAHSETRHVSPKLKRCHVFVELIQGQKFDFLLRQPPAAGPLNILEQIDGILQGKSGLSWPGNQLASPGSFIEECRELVELNDRITKLARELSLKQREQERSPGSVRDLHWQYEKSESVVFWLMGAPALGGPFVAFIKAGSAPARAGLRFGDLLLEADGKPALGVDVQTVIDRLKEHGTCRAKRVPFEQRAVIEKSAAGAPLAGITHKRGRISHVAADSPAATAGIPRDSQIVSVNGRSVLGLSDLELQDELDKTDRKVKLAFWPGAIFDQITANVDLNEVREENNKIANEEQEERE